MTLWPDNRDRAGGKQPAPGSSQALSNALNRMRAAMLPVFFFSLVVNVLLLTTPLFMLQVYDRVLISGSLETLLFLLLVALFTLTLLGVIDAIRQRIMVRIGNRFHSDLDSSVFASTLSRADTSKPLQDLSAVRNFLVSPYAMALFDAPWIPLFIALGYLLHPLLGHIGLAGAIILFGVAVLNELLSRHQHRKADQALGAASRFTEHSTRQKNAVIAMGMAPALSEHWQNLQRGGLTAQTKALDTHGLLGSIAKVVRQIIQVSVLATGAWLTLDHITSAGVMIAASIILARALAPIEQAIQGWRSLINARQSLAGLKDFMAEEQAGNTTSLPRPKGQIELSGLTYNAPYLGRQGVSVRPVIRELNLRLEAGGSLGLIGASGSGKTTLVSLIAGILQPSEGTVRLDGAEMIPSHRDQFAPSIGYLPQELELFDGTVAENIARFGQADSEAIVTAAQKAGAHELILTLPEGYETQIGPGGLKLSGGQKQKIALSRALFGSPSLLILDEPTASLDADSQQSVTALLQQLRQQKVTLIVISHQPALLTQLEQVAVLSEGRITQHGKASEVLAGLLPKQAPARQTGQRVVVSKSSVVKMDKHRHE